MLLGEVGPWTVVSWVLLVPPAGALATWVASRLLGVRRDGVSMVASGLVGFLLGIVFAGAVTAWEWDDIRMVGLTLVFGTVNTMVIAVGLDLLRAPGTAARIASMPAIAARASANFSSGPRPKQCGANRPTSPAAHAKNDGSFTGVK